MNTISLAVLRPRQLPPVRDLRRYVGVSIFIAPRARRCAPSGRTAAARRTSQFNYVNCLARFITSLFISGLGVRARITRAPIWLINQRGLRGAGGDATRVFLLLMHVEIQLRSIR